MEFLVRGATKDGEPGLFMSFEEGATELKANFRSMGFDLGALCDQKKLKIAPVELPRDETIEAGTFSLEPLLIRLKSGIEEIGAKRVVLDTMDALFSVFADTRTLRYEVSRLFGWLRESGVTAVTTGEQGADRLTRYGFDEYVSDCVMVLDHRVDEQISKRRLRVVKYRGSGHGKDEYPFLIDKDGFSVFPITSTGLDYVVGAERISTGVDDLDRMFGGKGYFKGSTVLASGKAGTNISSLADTWIALQQERERDTHRRGLHIIKSRGMNHSHEMRQLIIADNGISLCDPHSVRAAASD